VNPAGRPLNPATANPATALVDRVRNRLAATGASVCPGAVSPSAVADAVRAESDGVLADLQILAAMRELQQELVGAGPLEPLLADPETTDVLVSAPDQVWVEQGGELRRTDVCFADPEAVRRLAQRLALAAGRRLDDASPFVDAPLPGGVRCMPCCRRSPAAAPASRCECCDQPTMGWLPWRAPAACHSRPARCCGPSSPRGWLSWWSGVPGVATPPFA
jgi:Type II/IV secretion system protein